jgi:hypothetical protein
MVKGLCSGISRAGSTVIIDDFGIVNQELLLEAVDEVKKKKSAARIEVFIDYKATISIKERDKLRSASRIEALSPASAVYEESASKGSKFTEWPCRTKQLLVNNVVEVRRVSAMGDNVASLTLRWKCHDDSCRHKYLICYVDRIEEPPYHIQMNDADLCK